MANKEVNIKSSTIEKGLELAKDFVGKLISPTIEEVGLFIADNVKYFRFKNQINILLKAKEYVEKRKIHIKEIPIKILTPLLESASLEDNEIMQDKWAKMLVNLVDSENNLQNQIFPYILSQISIEEYIELQELINKELKYDDLNKEFTKLKENDKFIKKIETRQLHDEVNKIEQSGFWLELQEFERANLLRLGLIRQLPPKIYIDEFSTGNRNEGEVWHSIGAAYDPYDYGYRITELGEKFLLICELKEKNEAT